MGLAPKIVDEIFEFLGLLASQGASLLLFEPSSTSPPRTPEFRSVRLSPPKSAVRAGRCAVHRGPGHPLSGPSLGHAQKRPCTPGPATRIDCGSGCPAGRNPAPPAARRDGRHVEPAAVRDRSGTVGARGRAVPPSRSGRSHHSVVARHLRGRAVRSSRWRHGAPSGRPEDDRERCYPRRRPEVGGPAAVPRRPGTRDPSLPKGGRGSRGHSSDEARDRRRARGTVGPYRPGGCAFRGGLRPAAAGRHSGSCRGNRARQAG